MFKPNMIGKIMGLGTFATSTLAMNAQSHALSQISTNVANVNTTGYKCVDTQFATLVGGSQRSFLPESGGVTPVDRRFMLIQGTPMTTGRDQDLAISGDGFFVLNTSADGNGEEYYSRAGSFTTMLEGTGDSQTSYLVTPDGNYVMGWPATENGEFSTIMEPIDTEVYSAMEATATSNASIFANLNAASLDEEKIVVPVIDSNGNGKNISTLFTPINQANEWSLDFDVGEGTVTSTPTPVTFNGDGQIVTPTEGVTVSVAWDDGSTSDVTIDLNNLSQYASTRTTIDKIESDGNPTGDLVRTFFDNTGTYKAYYSNGRTRDIARLAIADFAAPTALEAKSGNLFAATEEAGDVEIFDLSETRKDTQVIAGALESSNVKIEDQFSKMIVTQRAYSSAAKAFQTGDEMMQQVRDLKR